MIATLVKNDYARASQIVFYAMAAVLVVAMAFALMHPGGRAGEESPTEQETEGVAA